MVVVEVNGEDVDESLVEVWCAVDAVAQAEIDVLGQARIVAYANLKCHTTFEYPLPRLCRLHAGDDAFEHHPST